MITHHALVSACKEQGLDPFLFEDNPFNSSRVITTFKEPADLASFGFPKKELEQIRGISRIIHNLYSQLPWRNQFDLTKKEDKDKLQKKRTIEQMLPILNSSLKYWLKKGLQQCESDPDPGKKKFTIHRGQIFEIDPEAVASIAKLNKDLAKFHRESDRKQARSARSAGKKRLC